MKLGSFFDGIGGWLLAAKHAGVKPLWASEIDDFPAAVTAHHFPNVRQMGDITKIDVDNLELVDIICAGSPCQDLSVAGKRKGLEGERSGLFIDAIKLVHGLRKRTGKPRYFVWENVPGAFSSNHGLDFRAVLEEVSQTSIPMPACGKWAEAGMVEWNGGSIAWRVLDAQYWGVPQRRKRIFLVADFDGRSAGEILFECQSVPRDSAESEGEGEGVAADAGANVDSASGVKYRQGAKAGNIGWQNGKAPTLELSQNCAIYSFDSLASNSMKSKNPHSGCRQVEVSKTLETTTPDPSKNQGGIAIFYMTHANDPVQSYNGKKCHTLTSRMGTGGNQVPVIHTIAGNIIGRDNKNGGHQLGIGHDVSPTLNTVDRHAVAVDVQQNKIVYPAGKVRRLTPMECERLQGLPDGYTDIEFNGKPAPDSRRYKALGNGMAQPCADYVIRRIQEVNDNGQT